jgi:hypothetical protein
VIFGITALYDNIAPLLTPGYEIAHLEPFGFLVFIGCLVYVVAYRFFLYTDGIIEAANAAGDLFGWSRFKEFITSHASLSVGNCADALIQHISSWSGRHLDDALDDDLTLIVADFKSS